MTENRGEGSRTALVTGGTRGLGRALALTFAGRGYRVYATARGQDGLAALAAEATERRLDIVPIRADHSRTDDNARVVGRISDDARRVYLAIHNAGLLGPRVELAAYPPDEFERVMAANLFAPFDLTRQLLPILAPAAAIIFVSSGVSLGPRRYWGAYNVSKIALDGLAGIWAKELRDRGVRVFIVDPGPMRTTMRADAYPQEDPRTLEPPEARTPVFVWLAERADLSLSGGRFKAEGFTPPPPAEPADSGRE